MNARYIIVGGFLCFWGICAIIATIKTGEIPGTLWAGLGMGLGAFAALFPDTKKSSGEDKQDKDENTMEAKP